MLRRSSRVDRGGKAERPSGPKPKQLSEEPELAIGEGGRGLAAMGADRTNRRLPRRAASGETAFTEETASEEEAGAGEGARDLSVITAARAIAARLAVARPPRQLAKRRGGGDLRSVRYSGDADEIDFDRTLEAIAERRPLAAEDVTVRERCRQKRAVVLAVDVSGSMRGARIRTAAATVGALSAELVRDDLAVIAFWSNAAVLLRLGERATPEGLIEGLLAIEPRGLTNVSFPLEVAERELRRMPDRRRRVLLLSDCVHNAGPEPAAVAARLPRLDVLLDTSGEQDPDLAGDLARQGRGVVATVTGYRDVAPALRLILG